MQGLFGQSADSERTFRDTGVNQTDSLGVNQTDSLGRMRFSHERTEILQAEFSRECYPSRQKVEELAEVCEATAHQVKVWFNNRRASEKAAGLLGKPRRGREGGVKGSRRGSRRPSAKGKGDEDEDGQQRSGGESDVQDADESDEDDAVEEGLVAVMAPPGVEGRMDEEEECTAVWPPPDAEPVVVVRAADGSELGKLPAPHGALLTRLMDEGHVRAAKIRRVHKACDAGGISVRIDVAMPRTAVCNPSVTSQLEDKASGSRRQVQSSPSLRGSVSAERLAMRA
eukprot:CAMPEP_0119378356 /NCGR_PEP_ID=MMETSP1334-20130426/47998_1 /TAXON_ID=127549 /ORGANISM="Calcidiscus leptoporus, Strain RCC1130" /LENGTH=283 /DNA_ID=CAMNT_0007397531 /DNA_START=13 /DNA_END=865 /DNA_ORIENTATION=+